ncbi:MAG: adenosylmethionine decarboxylase [Gammaproteobacteria bacterium]|nr:adenosylmethionine decarboxylase [Gammaproteobacteria bacterium]
MKSIKNHVTNRAVIKKKPPNNLSTEDYFLIKNGMEYSGTHLLIDLWEASRLDNQAYIEETLRCCVAACNATLLHIHLHQFSESGGISGVAVLAESHISVHTWPERHYAAFDVFMCGSASPLNAIAVLEKAFSPGDLKVKEILRGCKEND